MLRTYLSTFILFATFLYSQQGQQAKNIPTVELDPDIDIVELNDTYNVLASRDYINVVAFVDGKCVPCKVIVSVWNTLSKHFKEFKGKVRISIVDCTTKTALCMNHNISRFPTIRYFPPNSDINSYGIDIMPGSDLHTNKYFILQKIEEDMRKGIIQIPPKVLENIKKKPDVNEPPPGSTGPGGDNEGIHQETIQSEVCVKPRKAFNYVTHIQSVTSNNANKKLANQPYVILLGFYDMLCRPCLPFTDIWTQLSSDLQHIRSRIVFAGVNCATDAQLCDYFAVSSYPTIKYIPEYSTPKSFPLGTDIPTSLYISTVLHSITNEIIQQQLHGKAKVLPSLVPYVISNANDLMFNTTVALLVESANTGNGPRLILKYEGHDIRYTVANQFLNTQLRLRSLPALVFFYWDGFGKFNQIPSYVENNVDSMSQAILKFYRRT